MLEYVEQTHMGDRFPLTAYPESCIAIDLAGSWVAHYA
jgi:hypothetical protein